MKKPRLSIANSLENSGLGIGCQLVVGRSPRGSENWRTVKLETWNWRTVELPTSVFPARRQAGDFRSWFLVPCSLFLIPLFLVPLFLCSLFLGPRPPPLPRLPISHFHFPISDFFGLFRALNEG